MTLRTAADIAEAVIDLRFGPGTMWGEPNAYGETGFTRARDELEITHDDIVQFISEGVEVDRGIRDARERQTGEATGIVCPSPERFARFGRQVASILGTRGGWGAEELDQVAFAASVTLGVEVGSHDRSHLRFWQQIAQQVGVDYDPDVEPLHEEDPERIVQDFLDDLTDDPTATRVLDLIDESPDHPGRSDQS